MRNGELKLSSIPEKKPNFCSFPEGTCQECPFRDDCDLEDLQ